MPNNIRRCSVLNGVEHDPCHLEVRAVHCGFLPESTAWKEEEKGSFLVDDSDKNLTKTCSARWSGLTLSDTPGGSHDVRRRALYPCGLSPNHNPGPISRKTSGASPLRQTLRNTWPPASRLAGSRRTRETWETAASKRSLQGQIMWRSILGGVMKQSKGLRDNSGNLN